MSLNKRSISNSSSFKVRGKLRANSNIRCNQQVVAAQTKINRKAMTNLAKPTQKEEATILEREASQR